MRSIAALAVAVELAVDDADVVDVEDAVGI